MLFNSWEFIIFFGAVYAVYLVLPNHRLQNIFLLFSGYYFYAGWDWRFLFLLLISTVVDYIAGIQIDQHTDDRKRRLFLLISVGTQLTILGFFKYFNFFAQNLYTVIKGTGSAWAASSLNIILPVGISFYTFQSMGYIIDIYRRQLKPAKNFADYAIFASFFPQLVAGPIERARNLLPQISRARTLDLERIRSGCWLVFWGMYKKIVIADNLAPLVDVVYTASASATFLEAYLGTTAFAVQIYCDFSGYTDIARGIARLLGFELLRNFNLPFFARNPQDYWRRWHISLSTWLRDYLYISLGGNRKGTIRTYLNLFLTMLLGGLWHGASWNFLWWGAYHGVLLMVHRLVTSKKSYGVPVKKSLIDFGKMFMMLQFTFFGWLLFRSNRKVSIDGLVCDDSFQQVFELITSYRNGLGFNKSAVDMLSTIVLLATPLVLIQLFQFKKQDHYFMLKWNSLHAKAAFLAILAFIWIVWGVQSGNSFIYFQF